MDFSFIIAILLLATTLISLGIWVFQDSKKVGFNQYQWTLISLFVPAFLGVFLYLNKRSKQRNVICSKCRKATSVRDDKCENCKRELNSFKEIDQGGSRKYLLIFLVSFILWFIYFMFITIYSM